MKNTIYSILGLLIFAFTLNSCVKDTDYNTPQITIPTPELTGNSVKLSKVLTEWENNFSYNPIMSFDEDYEDYITVYVTSSDKTGNFYKELFVQDSVIDPTAAIKVNVDMSSLYSKYEIGRKIHIYLKGLGIGKNQSGEIVLSEMENRSLADYIRENVVKTNFIKDPEKAEIKGIEVESPASINESYLGKYVKINNVMFALDVIGENFTDPNESYDTHRTLTSCLDNTTIELETSSFASFKNSDLPAGMGSVEGIITMDYGNEFFVLRTNSDDVFTFDKERCDPEMINCGLANAQGTNNIFSEDFEGQTTFSLISGNGWTNYIEEGSQGWEAYTATGTNASLGISARMDSYKSGDDKNIAWLISPAINLDAQEGETLVFKTSNSYSDGSILEVVYSPDWDGTTETIKDATWGTLPAAYIVQDDDFYGDWKSSGIVDLSCAEGTIYIAFKFTGTSDTGFDGTYELDDISIDY